jgi:hypothetical protein
MTIDGKEAERIARDLIHEIASEWKDTPSTRCVEESDSFVFEFTVQPSQIIRYAHGVERPHSPSVFCFNPLAEATEIVNDCAEKLTQQVSTTDPTTLEHLIIANAGPRIYQMLRLAPTVFEDAMWQARIIADTLHSLGMMQMFGRPDIARGLINSTVAMIVTKLRERFPRIKQKQKSRLTVVQIGTAISVFLPAFEKTGAIPSRNQFAKQLGVSARGWREYLKRHHLGEHEVYLTELFQKFSTKG